MTPKTPSLDLGTVSGMDRSSFLAVFGPVFEHAHWVIEGAWAARPYATIDVLRSAMVNVVRRSPRRTQVAFLCLYPEITCPGALNHADSHELERLNALYRHQHGFPFIIAADHYGQDEIMTQLRQRLQRHSDAELETALDQISVITLLRIEEKVTA